MKVSGKCSWFGGPEDTGVAPDEGLAFIYDVADAPYLFLPEQPPGTTGLARRLDPTMPYVACRWNYDNPEQTREMLLRHVAVAYAPGTGRAFFCAPADWGPGVEDRVADLSPGLLGALGLETDGIVEITFPVIYERRFHEDLVGIGYRSRSGSAGNGRAGETQARSYLQALSPAGLHIARLLTGGSASGPRRLRSDQAHLVRSSRGCQHRSR